MADPDSRAGKHFTGTSSEVCKYFETDATEGSSDAIEYFETDATEDEEQVSSGPSDNDLEGIDGDQLASGPSGPSGSDLEGIDEDQLASGPSGPSGSDLEGIHGGRVESGVLEDGRIVAVKELTVRHKKQMEQFYNEARLLSKICHKNLNSLYGCTHPQSEKLLLVYKFAPNGTVADHLHGRRFAKDVLIWAKRIQIAIETAEALAFLHSLQPPIIHRDIKTDNILLNKHFKVKVADFGLCRRLPPGGAHVTSVPQGTQGYMDPEYNQFYKLTTKSDVFSFGVVLVELISGKAVLDEDRDDDEIWLVRMAFNKMKNKKLAELVDEQLGFSDDWEINKMVKMVADLAYKCLQPRGYMRPSMKEVVLELTKIRDWRQTLVTERPEVEEDDGTLAGLADWKKVSPSSLWKASSKYS